MDNHPKVKRDQKKKPDEKFQGFPLAKQTWDFPTVINGWVDQLSGAEFKVLWYILRHTYGWQKVADTISYGQFRHGIIRKSDGKVVDRGTGLGTQAIRQAIRDLVEKGFIEAEKRRFRGRQGITSYKIRFAPSSPDFENQNPTGGENQNPTDFENQKETIPNIRQSLIQDNVLLSKDKRTEAPASFPFKGKNQSIDLVVEYLKSRMNLPALDLPERTNRYYAALLLKKYEKVETIFGLIEAAARDPFWAPKITSTKHLYYNAMRIFSEHRSRKAKVLKI